MSMTKTIESFSSEPGFRAPTKFSGGADDFIFEETHEAREELWEKAKAGCRTAQRMLAVKYNIIELTLKGKNII